MVTSQYYTIRFYYLIDIHSSPILLSYTKLVITSKLFAPLLVDGKQKNTPRGCFSLVRNKTKFEYIPLLKLKEISNFAHHSNRH